MLVWLLLEKVKTLGFSFMPGPICELKQSWQASPWRNLTHAAVRRCIAAMAQMWFPHCIQINWALIKSATLCFVLFERDMAKGDHLLVIYLFYDKLVLTCVRKEVRCFSILSYLKHFVQGLNTCSWVKMICRTIPCDLKHNCTPTLLVGMWPVCHCLMAQNSVLSDWALSPVAPSCRHYIF